MRLAGKRCFVTGAAHGIGLAIARKFAQEGGAVLLCDVNGEGAEAAAAAIRAAGGKAHAARADVAVAADVEAAVAACVAAFGGLDVLVNNAGAGGGGAITEITDAAIDRVFGVNVRGMIYGIRAAVPHMRAAGGGSIVSISSVHALRGCPRGTLYDGSKAAILAMTRALAMELAPDRIRVNAICPGAIDTHPLDERLGVPPEWQEEFRARFWDDWVRGRERVQPFPRRGVADDIAYGALYLASDESAFVTGTYLLIDGLMVEQHVELPEGHAILDDVTRRAREWLKERGASEQ